MALSRLVSVTPLAPPGFVPVSTSVVAPVLALLKEVAKSIFAVGVVESLRNV
jgi:hypothetical protein